MRPGPASKADLPDGGASIRSHSLPGGGAEAGSEGETGRGHSLSFRAAALSFLCTSGVLPEKARLDTAGVIKGDYT
jgi:hypothetical protein